MRTVSVPPSNYQRQLNWREVGIRSHPSNMKERDRYGDHGVVVLGGILLNVPAELHVFDKGSVTGDRYCWEVILPRVHLTRLP
ncbi:transposable element Tcb2 transposase [Trichonephila clavipes]|nr:transposable element Tcb2 transposase [Trichonephila clavipes]